MGGASSSVLLHSILQTRERGVHRVWDTRSPVLSVGKHALDKFKVELRDTMSTTWCKWLRLEPSSESDTHIVGIPTDKSIARNVEPVTHKQMDDQVLFQAMRSTPWSRTIRAKVIHDDESTTTPGCPACEYAKRPVVTRGRPSHHNGEDIWTKRDWRAQQTTTGTAINCCGNPNFDTWEHRHTKGAWFTNSSTRSYGFWNPCLTKIWKVSRTCSVLMKSPVAWKSIHHTNEKNDVSERNTIDRRGRAGSKTDWVITIRGSQSADIRVQRSWGAKAVDVTQCDENARWLVKSRLYLKPFGRNSQKNAKEFHCPTPVTFSTFRMRFWILTLGVDVHRDTTGIRGPTKRGQLDHETGENCARSSRDDGRLWLQFCMCEDKGVRRIFQHSDYAMQVRYVFIHESRKACDHVRTRGWRHSCRRGGGGLSSTLALPLETFSLEYCERTHARWPWKQTLGTTLTTRHSRNSNEMLVVN